MRDDRERLRDVKEAIARIEQVAVRGKKAFSDDPLVQVWMVHHLQIIGEAARSLSESFRSSHEDWPWSRIIGMRNIIVHHYFEVSSAVVWDVVENHIPDLKSKVQSALKRPRKARSAKPAKKAPRQNKRKR